VVLRRREGALAAGALAACAIFLLADRGQSPYVAAKALMLASPLVMALALRSFPDLSAAGGRWRQGNLARLALVGVFGAGAAYSSSLALRAAPVASRAQQAELEGLRPLLGNRPTLFLGIDDHVGWWLRGVRLGTPQLAAFPSPITVSVRPEKPYGYGQPLDFDSFDHATLDGFSYVVAPRSPYDSDPPENFRRVRAGRLFEVWERRGPTAERETLEAPGAPGAVRDCRRPAQRRLQGAGGVAWVRAAPRVSNASAAAGIPPGSAAEMSLSLSPGRWRLGLQYVSTTPMRVLSGRSEWRLPPNTGRPGPFFELGTVDARGGAPTRFRVIAERTARLRSRGAGANVSALSATPEAAGRRISLDRSCHRYVDWYRLGTARR